MKALVAMLSPIKVEAMPVASRMSRLRSPTASRSVVRIAPISKSMSGFCTKLAVGCKSAFTKALVTPRSIRLSAVALADTTMSQPRMRSAPPEVMRTVAISSGVAAIRTWLMTAPFFCARPVKSSVEQPRPSMCAAIPSSAPMVMTPVPPIPVTRML